MISLKDWSLDILNNDGTTSETYTTKGKYITIGSSLSCNIRYFDQRVLKKHCKICINVKGKIQIINYAKNDPLLVDNEPIVKRSILDNNAIISLHHKKFLWKFNPKTNISLNKRKSLRRSIREKSIKLSKSIISCHKKFLSKTPTICSLARKSRNRKKKCGKRITVHNFEHMTNQLNKTSATECFSTPVSIIEFKENKTPRNTPMALSNSGVLILSYSSTPVGRGMRNTSFQTPKSGLRQNIVNMSTPKSVYKTPKGVLSEINETLNITKTPEWKNSMHLIDLTTPMTVKKNTASLIQKNKLATVTESVVDITTPNTPRTPKASTVKSNVKLLKSALKNASTKTPVKQSINLKTITSSRKGTPISETKCTEDVIVLLESPSTRSRSLRMPGGTPKSHLNTPATANSLKKLDNLMTPKRIPNSKLNSSQSDPKHITTPSRSSKLRIPTRSTKKILTLGANEEDSIIPTKEMTNFDKKNLVQKILTTPGCSSKKTSVEDFFQTPIKISRTPVNANLSGVKRLARTPRQSTNTKNNLTAADVKSSVLIPRPTTPTTTDNDCNDYNGELSNLQVQKNKNTDCEISSENIVTYLEKPITTVAVDFKSDDNIEVDILIGTEDKEVDTISIDIASKTEYVKYEQDLFVQDAFDLLIGKPVIKSTYTRKGKSLSPNKKFSSCQLLSNTTDLPKPDIVSWIESIETPILKPNCTRQILSSRYSNVTPHESFLDQKLSDETCEGLNEKQKRHSLISKRIQAVEESDFNSSCQYSSRRLSTLVLSPVTRISIIDYEKVIMAEENIVNSPTSADNDKDDAINISTKLTTNVKNDMSELMEICEESEDEKAANGKHETNFDNFTDTIKITAASSTVNIEMDKSSDTANKNEKIEKIGNISTEIEQKPMDAAEFDTIIQSNDNKEHKENKEDIAKNCNIAVTEDDLESIVEGIVDENLSPERNTTVNESVVPEISTEKVLISKENEIVSDNRTTETDTVRAEKIQNNENEESTSEICDSINNSVVVQEQGEDILINNIFDEENTTFEITNKKMAESITDDVNVCTETRFSHSQEIIESDLHEKDTREGIESTNITEPSTVSIDEIILTTPQLTTENLENSEENNLVENIISVPEKEKNKPDIAKLEIDNKLEQDSMSSDGLVNENNLISADMLNIEIDLKSSNIPVENDNGIVDERIISGEVTNEEAKNIENEENSSKVGTSGDEDKDLDESESFVLLDTDDEDESLRDEQNKNMTKADRQVIDTVDNLPNDTSVEVEKKPFQLSEEEDTTIETHTNDNEIIDLSKVEESISEENPAIINIEDSINFDTEEHRGMMIENDKKATEPHVASCKPEMQINPMGDKEDLQDQNDNELLEEKDAEVTNESDIKTSEKINASPNHEKRRTVQFAKPEEEEVMVEEEVKDDEEEEKDEQEAKEGESESDNVSIASANIELETDSTEIEYYILDGNDGNEEEPEDLTTTPVKEPRNDLTDVVGVKELLKTPNPGPRNDLTDVRGLKNLMRTPGNNPRNDLTDIVGVKELMKTPNPGPKNALTDVVGVKELLKTPNPGPRNDLTDVRGVKNLMRTPCNNPRNDLSDIVGVKELLKTPNPGPKNDLTDVRGIKTLLKTPGKEPQNDLNNVVGVKELLSTPNPGPKNDLSNLTGVRNLMRTPGNKPSNDLSNVVGVKELLKTPNFGPKNDLTNLVGVKNLLKTPCNKPRNDLTNVVGVKELMLTPNPGPKNDFTIVSGVKDLLKTPSNVPMNDLSDINIVTSTSGKDMFEVKPTGVDVQETEIISASKILGESEKPADEIILINESIDLAIPDTTDTISGILPTVDTDRYVESTKTEESNTFEKIITSGGLQSPTVEEAVASLHKEDDEMIITPHNDQIIDNSNEVETGNLESEGKCHEPIESIVVNVNISSKGNIAQVEAVPEVRHIADSSIIETKEIIKHDKLVADIEIVSEKSTDVQITEIPARTRRRRMTEDMENGTIAESKVKKVQSAPQIPNSRTRRRAVMEKPLIEEKATVEEVNTEDNLPTVSMVDELNADKPKVQPIELSSEVLEDQSTTKKPQRKGRKAKEVPIVNVEKESVQIVDNIQISDDPKISSVTVDTKPVVVLPGLADVSTPIRSKRLINKRTIEENKNNLTLEKDIKNTTKNTTKKRQPRNTGKQDKAEDKEPNEVDVQTPVSTVTESENIKETKAKRQPRKGKKNDEQAAKEVTETNIVEAAEIIVSELVLSTVTDIQNTPGTNKRVNKRNAGLIASSTPLLPVVAKRGRRNQITQFENVDDEVQISSIQYDTLDPADNTKNTATKPKRGRKVSQKTEEEVNPVPIKAEKPKRQTKKTATLVEIDNIALSTKTEEPDISTTDARPKRQIKVTAKMAQIKHEPEKKPAALEVESNISVVESKPKRQNKKIEKVIEAGSPKLETASIDAIDDTKKKTKPKSADLIATPSIKVELPVELESAASASTVRSKRQAKKTLKVDEIEEPKTEIEKFEVVQLSSQRSKRQAKAVTGKKNSTEAVEIVATPTANSKTRGKRNLKLDEVEESQSLKVPEVDVQNNSPTSSTGERPKRQSKKPLKLLEEQETEIKLTPAKKRAGRKAAVVTPEGDKPAASSKSKKVSSQSSEVPKESAKTVTKELKRISDSEVQGEEVDNPPKKKKNEVSDKKSDDLVIGKRTLRSRK